MKFYSEVTEMECLGEPPHRRKQPITGIIWSKHVAALMPMEREAKLEFKEPSGIIENNLEPPSTSKVFNSSLK